MEDLLYAVCYAIWDFMFEATAPSWWWSQPTTSSRLVLGNPGSRIKAERQTPFHVLCLDAEC